MSVILNLSQGHWTSLEVCTNWNLNHVFKLKCSFILFTNCLAIIFSCLKCQCFSTFPRTTLNSVSNNQNLIPSCHSQFFSSTFTTFVVHEYSTNRIKSFANPETPQHFFLLSPFSFLIFLFFSLIFSAILFAFIKEETNAKPKKKVLDKTFHPPKRRPCFGVVYLL